MGIDHKVLWENCWGFHSESTMENIKIIFRNEHLGEREF